MLQNRATTYTVWAKIKSDLAFKKTVQSGQKTQKQQTKKTKIHSAVQDKLVYLKTTIHLNSSLLDLYTFSEKLPKGCSAFKEKSNHKIKLNFFFIDLVF